MYDNKKIILEKTAFVEKETQNKKTEITKINKDDGSINMAFVDGELIIYLVKPEGKNTMKASDWLNGARLNIGSTLI
jgi:methionyl-tRNA formyltransferase